MRHRLSKMLGKVQTRRAKKILRLLNWSIPVIVILIVEFLFLRYTRQPHTPDLPVPPLKVLAANHDLELGNFAIVPYLNQPAYRDILTQQFGLALADNTPNWYFTDGGLRPSPTSYNFKQMDQVVAFAQDHNMSIQAHHYIWGEEKWLPTWLKNGNYTPPQLLGLMQDHILTVGHHYRGQIGEWSVVNEAFSRGQHIYGLHDWWADHIHSQSYIDSAFLWARQADPKSKLILNDFNDENQNSISDAMYAYVKVAKARGIPIDGIGMQMHIDGTNPPNKQAVIANMQRFGQLGLAVYLTEFDVNMNDVKASVGVKQQLEAEIYHDMVRACIESKVCRSFSILGITDKESWYNYVGASGAMPLPFDKNYQPKPAYYGLRQALLEP